jgi:hypothetical protein
MVAFKKSTTILCWKGKVLMNYFCWKFMCRINKNDKSENESRSRGELINWLFIFTRRMNNSIIMNHMNGMNGWSRIFLWCEKHHQYRSTALLPYCCLRGNSSVLVKAHCQARTKDL